MGMGSWRQGGEGKGGRGEGNRVAGTAREWPSSAGERAWVSDHQGVEAPKPQAFTQKDTQRGIKLQTEPRESTEHRDGEADVQGMGEQRTHGRPSL